MQASRPLGLLMEVARDRLREDGVDASLQDAADALGRGRRRVAREVDSTNVQTDTVREALAHWRALGHPELEMRITADGFTVGARETGSTRVVVDVLHGELGGETTPVPSFLANPGRAVVGAALLGVHQAARDLAGLREDLDADVAMLVRIAWTGPLLTRRLTAEVVGAATPEGFHAEGEGSCTLADLEVLHGAELDPERVAGLGVPLAGPASGYRLFDVPNAAWVLLVVGGAAASGAWPRVQAAAPGLERAARAIERALV
ncbi:MAG: hypothetical protein H6736_02965 [Alphaproteobacteria bacterium]|nr:hypothetical protein [Alphaproteobacteria bacterium]MCB9690755.1 hypothetical protein [Alphaproteobacteria bacterium]